MEWWKVVGLAGLSGVAATGAKVARDERQRKAYTTDEVRSRLHERADQPLDDAQEPVASEPEAGEPVEQEPAAQEPVDQEPAAQQAAEQES